MRSLRQFTNVAPSHSFNIQALEYHLSNRAGKLLEPSPEQADEACCGAGTQTMNIVYERAGYVFEVLGTFDEASDTIRTLVVPFREAKIIREAGVTAK